MHRVDDEVFWHAEGHAVPVEYTSTPIIIDGNTGGADKVAIANNGGARGSALTLSGGSSVISDLIIYGFPGSGIVMC